MSYPRYTLSRSFVKKDRNSTNITMNQTAITAVDTNLDLVLPAQIGDEIQFGWNGLVQGVNVVTGFDVYTMNGSTRVNPFGQGLTASMTSGQPAGVASWYCPLGGTCPMGPPVSRILEAGDIDSNGFVTMRFFYASNVTTARILYTGGGLTLSVWARNFGPAYVD